MVFQPVSPSHNGRRNVEVLLDLEYARDAHYLAKGLMDKVGPETVGSLKPFEAIVRIGNEVVRVRMNKALPIPPLNSRDRIIAESRERYYRPAHEVQRAVWPNSQRQPSFDTKAPLEPVLGVDATGKPKELFYREFRP